MNAFALAERLGLCRNRVRSFIQNERAGTISLNQLDKTADAMGQTRLRNHVPRGAGREDRSGKCPKMMAKRTIQRTRAHLVPQEQSEGFRSQDEMIEEPAIEIVLEMPKSPWK